MKASLKESSQYRCQKKQCHAAVGQQVRWCKYSSGDTDCCQSWTLPLAHAQKMINPKQNGYLPMQVQTKNLPKFSSHIISVYSKQSIEKTYHSKNTHAWKCKIHLLTWNCFSSQSTWFIGLEAHNEWESKLRRPAAGCFSSSCKSH